MEFCIQMRKSIWDAQSHYASSLKPKTHMLGKERGSQPHKGVEMRLVTLLWHWLHFIGCVVMLNNTSLKQRKIGVMENSNAWRGKAGKRDAKSAIDADDSGSCFPHGGRINAGFGGPAEGVLKISASKIFDQWLTADTHEGSHAHARMTAILQWPTMKLN